MGLETPMGKTNDSIYSKPMGFRNLPSGKRLQFANLKIAQSK